jgi:hypothetical protein
MINQAIQILAVNIFLRKKIYYFFLVRHHPGDRDGNRGAHVRHVCNQSSRICAVVSVLTVAGQTASQQCANYWPRGRARPVQASSTGIVHHIVYHIFPQS